MPHQPRRPVWGWVGLEQPWLLPWSLSPLKGVGGLSDSLRGGRTPLPCRDCLLLALLGLA